MRTPSRSARPRTRAIIVALLIALGVVASVGVGYAQPAGAVRDQPAAGTPAEQSGGGEKDGGEKDGGKTEGGKQRGGGADGEGAVCADGRRDTNPADGVCSRDGGPNRDGAGKDRARKDPPREDPNLVKGTPCTRTAEACADLAARKAWLITDGKVTRGPVRIASGGPGYETPRGTFTVQWKNRDHRSAEFDNAPMPFAVFFTDGGIAFHQGDLNSNSHGCIRLARADAEAFFNTLAVGDEVQVR